MIKLKKFLIFISYIIIFQVVFSFNTIYASHTSEMIFYKIDNNEVTITAGGNLNDVIIPNYIESYPVTKIASKALCLNPYYTSIKLPETLIFIDDEAILGCENIKEITIPKSVQNIGLYALGYIYNICPTDNYQGYIEVYEKMEDFTIKGYIGTIAETYAYENGFTFIALDESEVTTTVTTAVSTTTETTVSTTATTPIETTATTSTKITTTPTVTTATTTTSAVSNTTATETTSIITTATTTTTEPIKIAGDANGDNTLDVRDCAYIASMLAKGKKEEIPENANFNDDEIIDVRDAAAIAYYLANRYV